MENKDGGTALTVACRNGHSDIVGKLIDSGADINSGQDKAIINAAYGGHMTVVEMLLIHGE